MKVQINKNVLSLKENQNNIITINIIFGIKTKIYKSVLHSTVCGYLLIDIYTSSLQWLLVQIVVF